MKRRTARERYFADEWPSRRPGPRWCFTDRAALRRWRRPRSHRPRCLVPSHAAPPAPAAPPLHGLDRRCCCILQRRRRCDRHSVAGSGKRRRAYGQDGSGEKLAWQIHDLISIPDLQHRSRCNAVGQPAGLALRSVLAPRFGCDGAIHRLMPRNPRLVPTVPCAWRDQDQNLTKVFASPLSTSPELLIRWLRLF
jgi:hypothetical protein